LSIKENKKTDEKIAKAKKPSRVILKDKIYPPEKLSQRPNDSEREKENKNIDKINFSPTKFAVQMDNKKGNEETVRNDNIVHLLNKLL